MKFRTNSGTFKKGAFAIKDQWAGLQLSDLETTSTFITVLLLVKFNMNESHAWTG